jgi:hypothetical protein
MGANGGTKFFAILLYIMWMAYILHLIETSECSSLARRCVCSIFASPVPTCCSDQQLLLYQPSIGRDRAQDVPKRAWQGI